MTTPTPSQRGQAVVLRAVCLLSVLSVLCALMYGAYLWQGIPFNSDATLVCAPFFALRHGSQPAFWNPYTLSGSPVYNNLQYAWLYPPRMPFFWVSDWRDYFGLYYWLHYLVAMVGMAILLSLFNLNRWAILTGAVVYGCGGYLAGRMLNPVILTGSCWLPWLFCGAAGHKPWHRWTTTLAAAMLSTAGSPHSMVYGALGYLLLLVVATTHKNQTTTTAIKQLCACLLHPLVGVALAAPTLLPGIARVTQSVRAQASVRDTLANSVEWWELFPMLAGGSGGWLGPEQLDKSCYLGFVGIVLVVVGVWTGRHRVALCWKCGVCLVMVGSVLALGENIGWQVVLPYLPGARLLIGPGRALVLTMLGLSLLSALGMHQLQHLRVWVLPAIGAGSLALATMLTMLWHIPLGVLLSTWWFHVRSVPYPWYPVIDGAIGAGALVLVGWHTRRRWVQHSAVFAALVFQIVHFSPRVTSPVKPHSLFDPPENIAFLQSRIHTHQPFRVVGFDPVRVHDNNLHSHYLFQLLTPNLAWLYGLEDINGYDPLISADYRELIASTAGVRPYNDPLRNVEIDHPNEQLMDLLGVRFLVGHPYHRQLTNLPLTLTAQAPIQTVALPETMTDSARTPPITHWLIVSLINHTGELPDNTEVARLVIDADEGEFWFPVRNQRQSAPIAIDTNHPFDTKAGLVRYASWDADEHQSFSNYYGVIEFGQPLHIRHARWELAPPVAPDTQHLLYITSQGYRFARPQPARDPWRLAWGHPDDLDAVFEYLPARPRVSFIPNTELPYPTPNSPNTLTIDPTILASATGSALLSWERVGLSSYRIETQPQTPAGVVFLREPWDPGWHARLNGKPHPVTPVNTCWCAVRIPNGAYQLTIDYTPTELRWYFLMSGFVLAGLVAWVGVRVTRISLRCRSHP